MTNNATQDARRFDPGAWLRSMTDTRKNIKVDESLFNRLKAEKGDRRSWPQFLEDELLGDDSVDDDVAETIDELKNELSMAADPVVQPDVGELIDKVDTLADAVQEATDAAQRAEKKVDDLQP